MLTTQPESSSEVKERVELHSKVPNSFPGVKAAGRGVTLTTQPESSSEVKEIVELHSKGTEFLSRG